MLQPPIYLDPAPATEAFDYHNISSLVLCYILHFDCLISGWVFLSTRMPLAMQGQTAGLCGVTSIRLRMR